MRGLSQRFSVNRRLCTYILNRYLFLPFPFSGDEFDAHVKCVSEDQRYGAKKFNKGVIKKGEMKQESWVEMIRSIIKEVPNIKRSQRDLFNKIAGFDNVPRKKSKFMVTII